MNTLDKIKKRIQTIETLKNKHIKEVEITRQEAMELPNNIKDVDGVKLIVVAKLGDRAKKDCYAYQYSTCYGLKELYCKREECRFYKNDIRISKIEADIKRYAIK